MKAVIFDVDGTLYDQRKLRFRMVFDMVAELLYPPRNIYDIKIIWDFRKERDRNRLLAEPGIEDRQYAWGARRSRVSADRVRRVVNRWMFERPLRHLAACRYRGVRHFFRHLDRQNIRIGIFSDYPADEKISALGLWADVAVAATDPDVDRLKPDPRGLLQTAEKLGIPVSDCLFIGDRDDRDGACARAAGMRFILLHPKTAGYDSPALRREVDAWIHGK